MSSASDDQKRGKDWARRERERREWERLGSLEALLLGVMKERGILTVHELYSEMGLSQGSTTRALQKLVDQELAIKEADEHEGGRKTAFSVTDKGDLKLKELWESGVAHERRTFHGILITVTLANLLHDRRELMESIRTLKDLAGARRVEAVNLLSEASKKMSRTRYPVTAQYGLCQAIYGAGRIRGEGDALDQVVVALEAGLESHESEIEKHLRDEYEGG